jgi:hypothetical protein
MPHVRQREVLGEYTKIESGKHADPPELRKAVDQAKRVPCCSLRSSIGSPVTFTS